MESKSYDLEVSVRSIKVLDISDDKRLIAAFRKQMDFLLSSNASLPIHVISILGSANSGKSFLMNLLINYLKNDCKGVKGVVNMSSGFQIRRGTGPAYNAVHVYPEIFIRKYKTGEKFGIMLMDINGLFDGNFDVLQLQYNVCKALSSVMMLNVKDDKVSYSTLVDMVRYLKRDGYLSNHTHLKIVMRDKFRGNFIQLPLNSSSLHIFVKGMDGSHTTEKLCADLKQKFDNFTCFGLPKPSASVINHRFKGEIQHLPTEFVQAVDQLFADITEKNQYLLTGSQLATIFRQMTQMSAVVWDKFFSTFVRETDRKFYQNRSVMEEPPKSAPEHKTTPAQKTTKNTNDKPKKDETDRSTTNSYIGFKKYGFRSVDAKSEISSNSRGRSGNRTNREIYNRGPKTAFLERQVPPNEMVKNWINDVTATVSDVETDRPYYRDKKPEPVPKWKKTRNRNDSAKKKDSQCSTSTDLIDLSDTADSEVSVIEALKLGSTNNQINREEKETISKISSLLEPIENCVKKITLSDFECNDLTDQDDELIGAHSYYSSLKTITIKEVERLSNMQMAVLLCRSNPLETYRDLCTSIIKDTYQLSPKYPMPEVHAIYKDQIKEEIIEKTLRRAIKLAVENYRKHMLLNIDSYTRSDIKVAHFEFMPKLTSIFGVFWSNDRGKEELQTALEEEYFMIVKEFCFESLNRKLCNISNVNDLPGIQTSIQNEFFPTFTWMDPNNKIVKELLENDLTNKVANKTIELLKNDCDRRFLHRIQVGDASTQNIDAFFDAIKSDATSIMRIIDSSRVDDLLRELGRIKERYE